MAPDTAKQREIQRLIRRAEDARIDIRGKVQDLRHQLDVPSRIRGSLARNPSAWMLGSLTSGFVASKLLRRRPAPAKKKRTLVTALAGLTLTAVKPAAKIWLAERAKSWLASRYGAHPASRHPG